LRQALVLAAFPGVAAVAIVILPEAAVQAVPAPMVLAGPTALAAPLILPLFVFVIPAALVAETVPLLELQPAAAVPAEPLVVAALAQQAALVVVAVFVIEPVAAVVASVLAVRVGAALAVAPVRALVVVEY